MEEERSVFARLLTCVCVNVYLINEPQEVGFQHYLISVKTRNAPQKPLLVFCGVLCGERSEVSSLKDEKTATAQVFDVIFYYFPPSMPLCVWAKEGSYTGVRLPNGKSANGREQKNRGRLFFHLQQTTTDDDACMCGENPTLSLIASRLRKLILTVSKNSLQIRINCHVLHFNFQHHFMTVKCISEGSLVNTVKGTLPPVMFPPNPARSNLQ